MATKKKLSQLFICLDEDACCFIGESRDNEAEIYLEDSEKSAIENAMEFVEGPENDDDEAVIVYKLVPVAKVKRAGSTVERY